MIYSKECKYAIRAATYLAQHPDQRCLAREIAEEEGLPQFFLSKILQSLAREKLLTSIKGPNGGFSLARSANEITLNDIRELIDGNEDLEQCAVGLGTCADDMPCPLHETFKPLRERLKRYLQKTTLEKMAKAVSKKKKLLRLESKT